MQMELKTINIDDIVIKSRIREDLGDIDALAKSIGEFGLMSPILVNKKLVLLSGLRRIEACKKLGQTQIKALLVNLDDENVMFYIESQENLCRKSLTPAELDNEIEMKRKLALKKIRGESVLGRVWNRLKSLFGKKRK
jgi:ParB family chromosome partitioning protein